MLAHVVFALSNLLKTAGRRSLVLMVMLRRQKMRDSDSTLKQYGYLQTESRYK